MTLTRRDKEFCSTGSRKKIRQMENGISKFKNEDLIEPRMTTTLTTKPGKEDARQAVEWSCCNLGN